ncbi:alanine racemase [Billgrantia kenyensis]|uniref:Alanine racemase n=1 Tax=Billgrantia kenyensis TaxID=321266 RepID=A0A7V9W4Z1_9GAMM|nr:alanine racemase [Halomonas kenyensis]MBA2781157.1 alanine racemase [Halomonas kenyensis]MCG6663847.1 hypothetical protein [Halomonas kenyensis]
MALTHEFLSDVASTQGNAFYIFDDLAFRRNYLAFRDGLRNHYPKAEVAYAYKANYMPAIGQILAELDGMAEVVSRFEYEIARRYLQEECLIFNGPVKSDDDIAVALSLGSQVNLDSLAEVERVARLRVTGRPLEIGLRVSAIKADGEESRFGISVREGELARALDMLDTLGGVNVASLHCHLTTQDKSPEGFVDRLRELWSIARGLEGRHWLRSVNIGGGFFGELPETLKQQFACPISSIDSYTATIGRAFTQMHPERRIRLIIEPGVSVVANTMCFAVRVVDIRSRNGKLQALLDTSINSVNPTRSSLKVPLSVVTAHCKPDAKRRSYALVGNTCMEHDIIEPELEANLNAGDFIVFENRGAYSINYTPDFIHPAPAIVSREGKVLKTADSVSTSLASYNSIVDPGGNG